jgi:hypothetical protein
LLKLPEPQNHCIAHLYEQSYEQRHEHQADSDPEDRVAFSAGLALVIFVHARVPFRFPLNRFAAIAPLNQNSEDFQRQEGDRAP